MVIIQEDDIKIDLYERRGDIIIHRQMERKDGFCYMRMKTRKLIS